MKLDRYTSIVIASYIPDDNRDLRAKMLKTSIDSLLETTKNLPVEIIVVDNGDDVRISGFLQGLTMGGAIQTYIFNANNMHFGFARNQGLASANGNYICIADNDIYYEEGWLEACLEILESYPLRKIYATPLDYPTGVLDKKYHQGELPLRPGEEPYILSMRAGSNCFVARERDFYNIGKFKNHRIAGTKWTDEAVHKGYLAAVCPGKLAIDLGKRQGYNHREPLPIMRTLRNGERVYFNDDEFQAVSN